MISMMFIILLINHDNYNNNDNSLTKISSATLPESFPASSSWMSAGLRERSLDSAISAFSFVYVAIV